MVTVRIPRTRERRGEEDERIEDRERTRFNADPERVNKRKRRDFSRRIIRRCESRFFLRLNRNSMAQL